MKYLDITPDFNVAIEHTSIWGSLIIGENGINNLGQFYKLMIEAHSPEEIKSSNFSGREVPENIQAAYEKLVQPVLAKIKDPNHKITNQDIHRAYGV